MRWNKLGMTFRVSGNYPWMMTHATHPVILGINKGIYRIYFSTRDKKGCSNAGYIEVDIKKPDRILFISSEPVLTPGPLGNFDDHGVYAGSLVEHEGRLYMYYIGWNRGETPPLFYSELGLAISTDGGKSFSKFSSAPIMARSEFDPCGVLLPYVIKEDKLWRMWYGSAFKWEKRQQSLHSYYDIKYAESTDGIEWKRNGLICIRLKKDEMNVAHPYLLKEDGIYKMWYSFNKGEGYRIGYAESTDGKNWSRRDEQAGIDLSDSGWDSESISHPCVFIDSVKKYMFYNGNHFGHEGFGIAVEGI